MWAYWWCLNTKSLSIMTCWNNELAQQYDIPPISGHTKPCHRCVLTDDTWTQSCSASWPAGTMNLLRVMTSHLLVVIRNHATHVDLLMMPERRDVQLRDQLEQWSCSALRHTANRWSYKLMPQMWTYWWCLTTKLFSIMTCWNKEPVQHYDIPPAGGHTKSCHRCGLTYDVWTQSCSASWPAGTKKMFNIMTYHLLVVIQNHATDVDLMMMPEHKVVQHQDLLEQWSFSAL